MLFLIDMGRRFKFKSESITSSGICSISHGYLSKAPPHQPPSPSPQIKKQNKILETFTLSLKSNCKNYDSTTKIYWILDLIKKKVCFCNAHLFYYPKLFHFNKFYLLMYLNHLWAKEVNHRSVISYANYMEEIWMDQHYNSVAVTVQLMPSI